MMPLAFLKVTFDLKPTRRRLLREPKSALDGNSNGSRRAAACGLTYLLFMTTPADNLSTYLRSFYRS